MASPRSAAAARQRAAQSQQAGRKKARRAGLRVRTDAWQSPRSHSALQGDELAISAITMTHRYPPVQQTEQAHTDQQSKPVGDTQRPREVGGGAAKRRPPPTEPRVLTPNTAAAARRVSWGSSTSSVGSTSQSEGESESEIVKQLPLPSVSPCYSPRYSPRLLGSTHVPAIKGARWVREQRVSSERTRRHAAEVQALRSSAEEAALHRDLSRVQEQIEQERLRLSQERHSPPSRQAWGEASEQASEEGLWDESDTSCGSSGASDASSCAVSSSGSSSSFTMRMRFKLPSRLGGGSARLALAAGEDAFSAAERFGREHSLRGPEVEKVRQAIETQFLRVEQRLRSGEARAAVPPPVCAHGQAPVSMPAAEAMPDSTSHSATAAAKQLQTWVSMTPDEVMEWRMLQQCKQRVNGAVSPSLPVRELAQTFQSRWTKRGTTASAERPPPSTSVAPQGMVLPAAPHRATYSPRAVARSDDSSGDSDLSESDSDSDSSSSEDEDETETDTVDAMLRLSLRDSAESLRLSAENAAGTSQQQPEPEPEQQQQQQTRHSSVQEKADDPCAPVVRGKSINIGVEGATPKEVKDVSLARTPTKQVRNMGRYRRRASKAQAEAELHATLQHYSGLLTAATHRRGHARHVIDLPAHVVAQYREKIAECQQRLVEMQPGYVKDGTSRGTRFRPWFIGDVCQLVRNTEVGQTTAEPLIAAAEQGAASSSQQPLSDNMFDVGRVAYVGTAPALGRGVWVGLILERSSAGEHDGTVAGRQYFSCEAGQGVLVRPDVLLPVSDGSDTRPEPRHD